MSISGEGTWSDTDEDWLIRKILQTLAEYDRKVIAARTRAAMLRHQAGGRRMSNLLPFGWQPDADDPSRMVPDEDELLAIEKIKELWDTEEYSLRKIAAELTRLGFKPRPVKRKFKDRTVECKGKWHYSTIRAILRRAEQETS